MGQHDFQVGERIHYYLPVDHPNRMKPRTGIIVGLWGTPEAGSPIYAIVREETLSGGENDQVIALPYDGHE
jgi:hypothetical protein